MDVARLRGLDQVALLALASLLWAVPIGVLLWLTWLLGLGGS